MSTDIRTKTISFQTKNVWAQKRRLQLSTIRRKFVVFYFSLAGLDLSCISRNIMISRALLLVSSPILNSLRSLRKEAATASPVCSALSFSCRSLAICAEKHAWPRAFGAFRQQAGLVKFCGASVTLHSMHLPTATRILHGNGAEH